MDNPYTGIRRDTMQRADSVSSQRYPRSHAKSCPPRRARSSLAREIVSASPSEILAPAESTRNVVLRGGRGRAICSNKIARGERSAGGAGHDYACMFRFFCKPTFLHAASCPYQDPFTSLFLSEGGSLQTCLLFSLKSSLRIPWALRHAQSSTITQQDIFQCAFSP